MPIDSCQNGTDHYRKTNVVFSAQQTIKLEWNDNLAHTNWLDCRIRSIRHPYERELTVIEIGHSLAIITWLYHGLFF